MALDPAYRSLPFDGAVDFFREKVRLPTRTWTDIHHGMHARGFVVAGAMKDALLADFQGAIQKTLDKGTTLAEFQKDFDRTVATHGWSHTGDRQWRARVIYETNVRTAYQAGRHKQMTDPGLQRLRPYWQYKHGDSRVPRPEHLKWDGLVLAADDPWWQTHYPPNGWGCKCKVFTLSRRDLERLGKTGPDAAPPTEIEQQRLGRDGPVVGVPKGVDPGWGYNVGEAAWGRNQALRLMEDQGPWQAIVPRGPEHYGRPATLTVDAPSARVAAPVTRGDETALRRALRDAIGGDEATFRDPTGTDVSITQAIPDHILQRPGSRWDGRDAYFGFIPELIQDPYEVWVNFARSEVSGRVALRRRYVKAVQLDRTRVLGLYAELQDGQWVSGDFFRGGLTGAGNLRNGRLVYGR